MCEYTVLQKRKQFLGFNAFFGLLQPNASYLHKLRISILPQLHSEIRRLNSFLSVFVIFEAIGPEFKLKFQKVQTTL